MMESLSGYQSDTDSVQPSNAPPPYKMSNSSDNSQETMDTGQEREFHGRDAQDERHSNNQSNERGDAESNSRRHHHKRSGRDRPSGEKRRSRSPRRSPRRRSKERDQKRRSRDRSPGKRRSKERSSRDSKARRRSRSRSHERKRHRSRSPIRFKDHRRPYRSPSRSPHRWRRPYYKGRSYRGRSRSRSFSGSRSRSRSPIFGRGKWRRGPITPVVDMKKKNAEKLRKAGIHPEDLSSIIDSIVSNSSDATPPVIEVKPVLPSPPKTAAAAALSVLNASLISGAPSGQVTPQEAVHQAMAALVAQAQEKTGVEIPKYLNPSAVNPVKYAEQIQKRKLLWGTKQEEAQKTAAASSNQWEKTIFAQDQDGKMAAKFKKLMGIKGEEGGPEAVGDTHPAARESEDMIRKQEELFRSLDQQYEMARISTHTHRGVGLGFAAPQFPK